MKTVRKEINNKGFSLVELIVIMAIMVVAIGMASLSVSILTGSEAKQACEKISAQLNEVKTGSMARMDEDFNVVYVADPDTTDTVWADKAGYYVVKQMYTFEKDDTSAKGYKSVCSGVEHRYLCNDRVTMTFAYDGGTEDEIPSGKGIGILFDRATGLYKGVKVNCVLESDGSINGTEVDKQPVSLTMKSGLKSYRIDFISETGKHQIVKE